MNEDKKLEDDLDFEIEIEDTPVDDDSSNLDDKEPEDELPENDDDDELPPQDEADEASKADSADVEEDEAPKGTRAERRIRKLLRRAKEAEERAEALSKKLEDSDGARVKSESVAVREYGERLEAQEIAVKRALTDAVNEGDVTKQVDAQDNLARLKAERANFDAFKSRRGDPDKPKDEANAPKKEDTPAPRGPDRRAIQWNKRNDWFGGESRRDQIRTNAALSIHSELLDEGIDPENEPEEYYNQLDLRLTDEFPELKKKNTRSNQRVTNSKAGAARSTQNGKRKVKLTREQVKAATKLGVTLEDYARELMKLENAQ